MAKKEFTPPAFLTGQSADEIHRRMMDALPDTIDKGEGGFPWDFTRPAANEKAEMVEFVLMNAIQSIFPMFSDGILLDYHAKGRGILRKAAEYAHGTVTITGTPGLVIPQGFGVTTAAGYETAAVGFRTNLEATLNEGGTAEIPITAVNPGMNGNVAAGTITIQDEPIVGIISLRNQNATTGGIDEEDDDSLRSRIEDYDAAQGVSFVGSSNDFKRWAMEVPGVGGATVQGGTGGDGVVKIILTDSTGKPAGEDLRNAVYNHIMRPDHEPSRLAGVNTDLRVLAPESLTIAVAARIETDGTTTVEETEAALLKLLQDYYLSETLHDEPGRPEGIVRQTAVGAMLRQCPGVVDYSGLTLNGKAENVTVAAGQIPSTERGDITLTEG